MGWQDDQNLNKMKIELIFFATFAIVAFFAFTYFVPINLWITALFSGVQVDLMQLVFMRIRKAPIKQIIFSLITLTKAGVEIDITTLETHALAGGDLVGLTKALIKVKSLDVAIEPLELMAQDLAENDLMQYIAKRKDGHASGIDEIKQKLCARIWEDLNDDQVRDVEKYMSSY